MKAADGKTEAGQRDAAADQMKLQAAKTENTAGEAHFHRQRSLSFEGSGRSRAFKQNSGQASLINEAACPLFY